MKRAGIYRHQLFRRSEPFIQDQASLLPGFDPIFIGRDIEGPIPDGIKCFALSKDCGNPGLFAKAAQMISRNPSQYIKGLKAEKLSLMHAHFAVEGVYAMRVASGLDIPLVTTFHGFDATLSTRSLLGSRKISWLNYLFLRKRLANYGAKFICVSSFIRDRVLALGFPEEKLELHYIGVDTEKLAARALQKTEAPVITHVARLVEKKGTSDLINAFSITAKKYPEAVLQVIGDGPLKAGLENQVQGLGLERNVHFLGALPNAEVIEKVARSWIFCLPSVTAESGDMEGLPISILEAAALGIPVVSTRHAGIPEAIVDEKTGLLVVERNINGISDSLSNLIANSNLRNQFGDAARKHMQKHFDIRKQSAVLAEIYGKLL